MIVPLDGTDWQLREALGDTWAWYASARLPDAGNNVADAVQAALRTPGWLPAGVPGSVIDDLLRAGEVADPRVGRQSRQSEWVAERSWVYRTRVAPVGLAAGERAVLEFDGIDPGGTVFWDGEEIGRVDGLYHRARFDVTDRLGGGSHTLAVVVAPAPDSEPQVGRTERVRVHSPRMNYGWDFCPRLKHQGIWKGVRLVTGPVLLADVTARTEVDGSTGVAHVAVALESAAGTPVHLEAVLLDEAGRTVAATESSVLPDADGRADARLRLSVARPALWWPNGAGAQPLYELRVTARASDGPTASVASATAAALPGPAAREPEDPAAPPGPTARAPERPVAVPRDDQSAAQPSAQWSAHQCAQWSARVGFRHIALVQNAGAEADALPYTAVVNGRPVPLVGWNWVPVDALHGTVTAERVRHLVGLAAASGARVLRVWGGGLIESHDFYDACDAAGLLVWQEFSQSSSGMQSAPATDPEFVERMRLEAATIVPTLTRHPSLFCWGGGNELAEGDLPLDDGSPVLAVLAGEVRRLDPDRHWLPTSPSGPEFHNRADRIRAHPAGQHDVHGPWEHQGLVAHYALYNSGASLAHTEFGVEGMTNPRSLAALIPEEDRWPADRTNPVYRHLGEWWNNADLVRASFGDRLDTLERMRRASQLLQATGLGYAVEADRRRWPHCSLVLPWQLNESFPNAWCTASVDYRGDPKPAYHAVARAFAPTRATVRVERAVFGGLADLRAEAWVWAEAGVPAGSTLTARLLGADGSVLGAREWTLDAVADPVPVGELVVAHPGQQRVVVWQLDWRAADDTVLDHEAMLASTGPDWSALLDLPPAELEVAVTGAEEQRLVRIRHLAGPLVVGLQLVDERPADAPGWVVIDGDPRPLLPGEQRTWSAHGASGPLRLESWNTETLELA